MAVALLVLGIVAVTGTVVGLTNPRRPFLLQAPCFFAAWLHQDLPVPVAASQAVVAGALVAGGGLRATAGIVGLGLFVASWAGLAVLRWRMGRAGAVVDAAVDATIAELGVAPGRPPAGAAGASGATGLVFRPWRQPFVPRVAGVEVIRDVPYGAHPRQRLDVLRPAGAVQGAPVLLQIHGGAWTIGDKHQQGQPLMRHLAARGWVCVAPNYRLSPRVRFPQHLLDVKEALVWVRRHVADYGGDPAFVAVTGGSAGGHLASLVALTAGDPRYQPFDPEADTAVQACVPMYGVYDFADSHGVAGTRRMQRFLTRTVMPGPPASDPDGWRAASPLAQVHPDAPPFLVFHGAGDALAWVEEARHFVEALRAVSRQPVGYVELPDVNHAFDVMVNRRSVAVVHGIERFLDAVHVRWAAARDGGGAVSPAPTVPDGTGGVEPPVGGTGDAQALAGRGRPSS